ncbi:DUF892 family protein [Tomitella cavernea]|uniref:Ferritin-like domain-containing protein n=1 Tax=Tomitella cavernea TaxID=1387982 RepID=A0ABP9CY42_9ACTN|nr:DUF892 family protein [Tomitella cavernea]
MSRTQMQERNVPARDTGRTPAAESGRPRDNEANESLIAQLRVLQALTRREQQTAQARETQARTQALRARFAKTATDARRHSDRIASALRGLDAVPDVVTPAIGRIVAAGQALVEQGEPTRETLFDDLTLAQQLHDRARYTAALADAAGRRQIAALARDLADSHAGTAAWVREALDKDAAGGPPVIAPTAVQRSVVWVTRIAGYPARVTAEQVNAVADRLRSVQRRIGGATAAVDESLTAGRDASLATAQTIAERDDATGTASALRAARTAAGALRHDELPVSDYDDLTVAQVGDAAAQLTRPEDLTALVRYEQHHKDRTGAVDALNARRDAIADASR